MTSLDTKTTSLQTTTFADLNRCCCTYGSRTQLLERKVLADLFRDFGNYALLLGGRPNVVLGTAALRAHLLCEGDRLHVA